MARKPLSVTQLLPPPKDRLLLRVRCVESTTRTSRMGTVFQQLKLEVVGRPYHVFLNVFPNVDSVGAQNVLDALRAKSFKDAIGHSCYAELRLEKSYGIWNVRRLTRYRRRPYDNREVF